MVGDRSMATGTIRCFFLVVALIGSSTLVRSDDQGEKANKADTISGVLRDWHERSQSFKTLTVLATGKAHYRKGMFNGNEHLPAGFKGDVPAEDCTKPISRKWWIDFEKGRYRHEYSLSTIYLTRNPPSFSHYEQTVMFDGQFVYITGVSGDGKIRTKHVVIMTPDAAEPRLRVTGYEPIAWATGNITPGGMGRHRVDRVRTPLTKQDVADAGRVVVGRRSLHHIVVFPPPRPNVPRASRGYTKLRIDPQRKSLVVRGSWVHPVRRGILGETSFTSTNGTEGRLAQQESFWFELSYRKQAGDWALAGWSWDSARDSQWKNTYQVTKWQPNVPIDAGVFKPHYTPGTEITDQTVDPPVRLKVDENGVPVPQK